MVQTKSAPGKKAAPKKAAASKKAPAKKAPATKAAAKKSAPALQATTPSPAVPVLPPPPPPPPPAPAPRRRLPVVPVIAVVLLILAAALVLSLADKEWMGGPPHEGIFMGDGVPGTLYVPGERVDDRFPDPKPAGQRPPLVIIAHGYSADQQGMSIMARSLAESGYATLTFDFRGHGYNRNRFEGDITQDLDTVLDWAETSPYIDPTRISVLGHSMGAGAATDFATKDKRVTTVIPVSGAGTLNEVNTPQNVLFIVASGDPDDIHDEMSEAATILKARPGVSVRSVEIEKTDHVTVIRDGQTFQAITDFLDGVYGGAPADRESTGRNDPRLGTVVLYLLVAVALIGFLGLAIGRAVQPAPSTTTGGAWILLAASMLVTGPLMALGGPGFLPLGAGQPVAISLGLAAALIWAVRFYAHRGVLTGRMATWVGDGPWLPLRSVWLPGTAAGLIIFMLLAPGAVVLHSAIPNVERFIYWVVLAAAMLPFFAAFETIVRRGSTLRAIIFGVLGRILTIAVLRFGIMVGLLPGVLGLVGQLLILQYFVLEIFAATCYAKGRNPAVIAVVDSIFIAWIAVMFSPIG